MLVELSQRLALSALLVAETKFPFGSNRSVTAWAVNSSPLSLSTIVAVILDTPM